MSSSGLVADTTVSNGVSVTEVIHSNREPIWMLGIKDHKKKSYLLQQGVVLDEVEDNTETPDPLYYQVLWETYSGDTKTTWELYSLIQTTSHYMRYQINMQRTSRRRKRRVEDLLNLSSSSASSSSSSSSDDYRDGCKKIKSAYLQSNLTPLTHAQ